MLTLLSLERALLLPPWLQLKLQPPLERDALLWPCELLWLSSFWLSLVSLLGSTELLDPLLKQPETKNKANASEITFIVFFILWVTSVLYDITIYCYEKMIVLLYKEWLFNYITKKATPYDVAFVLYFWIIRWHGSHTLIMYKNLNV